MLRLPSHRPWALLSGLASTAVLAYVVVAALAGPPGTEASTTSNLNQVSAGSEDWWWNYDFTNQNVYTTNVDWPARWMFAGNAEVNKIKNRIDGCGGDPEISPHKCNGGSAKHMLIYDIYRSSSPTWKSDGGKKSGYYCQLDNHLRIYALGDRDYSPVLGYYVLGTNHLDRENGSCEDTYWSEEVDEAWWRDRITNHLSGYGWVVYADASNWLNYESYHDAAPPGEPDHYVESNGLTTYVDVP